MWVINQLTSIHRYFLAGLLFAMAATTQASTQHDVLSKLHDTRVKTYSIMVSYFMYSGLEGDRRYERQINKTSSEIDGILKELTALPDVEQIAAVMKEWQAYRKLLRTNVSDFKERGFADTRLVQDLGEQNLKVIEVVNNVYDTFLVNKNMTLPEPVVISRNLGITIQAIAAQYAARSTSTMGQVFISVKGEEDLDLLIKRFAQNLDTLDKKAVAANKGKNQMTSVKTKWAFIQKPLSNYNENAVPFVVKAYGDRITQNLNEVAAQFTGSIKTASN